MGEGDHVTDTRTWAEIDKAVYAYEHANPTRRITRIFFDGDDAPEHYVGMKSECDVEHGAPAIRLSSGDIIEI